MNRLTISVCILFLSMFFTSSVIGFADEPVSILIQPKGSVSYSIDGTTWHAVNRTKFLYAGAFVKTGNKGSCKLINKGTETVERISGDTRLKIHAGGTEILTGNVQEPEPAGSLKGFWSRKMARLQKYVGVQRHSNRNGTLKTVRDITLSDTYPDLVWENAGSRYEYRLTIDNRMFHVPGTDNDVVRYKVSGINPGCYDYNVALLYKGEVVFMPERKGKLRWLSQPRLAELRRQEARIRQIAEDNGFLLGSLMDEHGLKVAAMDLYRKFLNENPDTHEVRPFMIKILSELKLNRLKAAEVLAYQRRDSQ